VHEALSPASLPNATTSKSKKLSIEQVRVKVLSGRSTKNFPHHPIAETRQPPPLVMPRRELSALSQHTRYHCHTMGDRML
jgi:hypothetical protein